MGTSGSYVSNATVKVEDTGRINIEKFIDA